METKRGEKYDFKTKFIHIDLTYGLNSNEDDQKYIMNTEKWISFEEGKEQGISQGIEQGINSTIKKHVLTKYFFRVNF